MKKIIILLLLALCADGWAQSDLVRKNVRQGNRQYNKEKYDEAETHYRKALNADSTYYKSQYNLGNALYRKKSYAEAASHYAQALQNERLSKKDRSQIFHNKGNAHLQAGLQDRANGLQQFQEAVSSYQESLKLNPKNEDTRYNLSYAKKLLQQAQQQQQNQGGGQNDQNQDNKDQNKGSNDQNQQDKQNQQGQNDKDQQDKGRQNQQGQQKPDQKDQHGQNQQQQQKKADAERMLEAVRNNEKNTMKEHQKQLKVGQGVRIEKDW